MANRLQMMTSLALLVALTVGGCGDPTAGTPAEDPVDVFRAALPRAADLELSVPDDSAETGALSVIEAPLSVIEAPLVGERSAFYELARTSVRDTNRGLAAILDPIANVIDTVPPVSVEENRAMWFGSGLADPEQHLLVVDRKDDRHFEYALYSRLKTEATDPDAWRAVIGGTFTPAGQGRGQGAVWVNANNDLDPASTGQFLALWSNANEDRGRSVTLYQYEYAANTALAPPINAAAHFQSEPDESGVYVYGISDVDIHKQDPTKPLGENVAVITRWTPSGAGRADWYATGGEVATDGYDVALMSECWGKAFNATFDMLVVRPHGQELVVVNSSGQHAACVFDEPGDPVFPDMVDAPGDRALPQDAP
jgi:hypothetical protein